MKKILKNISCYYFNNHNEQIFLNHINKSDYKFILNCGTPRKLSCKFLYSSLMRVVNIHLEVLPDYRGSCCVERAILNIDEVGNIAHFMTNDYNEGPIIFIENYNVKHQNNYIDVRFLVIKKWIGLMVKIIDYLIGIYISKLSLRVLKGRYLYSPIPDDQLIIVKNKIKNFDRKNVDVSYN